MRVFLWAALVMLIAPAVWAQRPGAVNGRLMDTILHQPVANASVTLLRPADSMLITYTLTTDKGVFVLTGVPRGSYYLTITHIQYRPLQVPVTVSGSGVAVEMGVLVMHDRSDTLGEVTVKAPPPPITMIGDTLQYNAGSFKVPPNSNVEELLRKLPGVEVGRDGSIRVQGRPVTDVLVDGKQFFGHDPKVATRNLQADAVDKVQVFDRLSDQAQWTGFNDGNGHQTINLKLKDDRKKGAFGTVRAGAGTSGRYAGQGNINAFTGNHQLSVIGQSNNINSDGSSYGVADGGNGLVTMWGAGLNLNSSLGKSAGLEGSYQFNNTSPRISETVKRQYLLGDSSYLYRESSENRSYNNDHHVQTEIDLIPGPSSSFKIIPSLNIQHNRQSSVSNYQQENAAGYLSHAGANNSSSVNDTYDLANELMYRKKLGRAGRTFSFSLQTGFTGGHDAGQLSSFNTLYDAYGHAITTPLDTVLQQHNNTNGSYTYAAKAIYTEPLWRSSLLAFSLEQNNTGSRAKTAVFDRNPLSGKYDLPDTSQSNSFSNSDINTNAGIQWLTQRKKYRHNVGVTLQRRRLSGSVDTIPGRTFISLLVKAGSRYNFTHFKYLSFDYQTSTTPPSADQLQPVQRFSNPLFIREGNPGLRQEYIHSAQISYSSMNPIRARTFNASLSAGTTLHHILMATTVDSIGVQHSRPVNVEGCNNLNADVQVGFPLNALRLKLGLSLRGGYNRNKQIVNKVVGNVDVFTGGPGLQVEFDPLETLDIEMTARLDMNATHYALQPGVASSWSTQSYISAIRWRLPADFFLGTDVSYSVNSGAVSGTGTHVPLWNAFLSVRFLRSQRAELKLSVHDLLDQNIQISNTSSSEYVENRQILSLRRFGLLTFLYNLQGITIK